MSLSVKTRNQNGAILERSPLPPSLGLRVYPGGQEVRKAEIDRLWTKLYPWARSRYAEEVTV
jgi:hypothetical protein